MNQRDLELLDKQLRRLNPPRNDGVIGLAVLVVFFIGIAVGSALFANHGGGRTTTNDVAVATSLLDQGPPTLR